MPPILRLVPKDDPPMIRDEFDEHDRMDWPDAGWALIVMAIGGWAIVVALAMLGAW